MIGERPVMEEEDEDSESEEENSLSRTTYSGKKGNLS
jgi:hypothetical protein